MRRGFPASVSVLPHPDALQLLRATLRRSREQGITDDDIRARQAALHRNVWVHPRLAESDVAKQSNPSKSLSVQSRRIEAARNRSKAKGRPQRRANDHLLHGFPFGPSHLSFFCNITYCALRLYAILFLGKRLRSRELSCSWCSMKAGMCNSFIPRP